MPLPDSQFGGIRILGLIPPHATEPPWVVWALGAPQLPWSLGFSFGGSVVSHTVPYHDDCLFTFLPQLCVLYSEALWQRAIFSL